jgi:hypothetical protein
MCCEKFIIQKSLRLFGFICPDPIGAVQCPQGSLAHGRPMATVALPLKKENYFYKNVFEALKLIEKINSQAFRF